MYSKIFSLEEEEPIRQDILQESKDIDGLDQVRLDETAEEVRTAISEKLNYKSMPTSLAPNWEEQNLITHIISTGNHPPIKSTSYRVNDKVLADIRREVADMLKLGIIKESNSASPIILVKKTD